MFFTIFWALWVVVAIIVELVAVRNRNPNDTLSEHVWKWVTGQVYKTRAIPVWFAWIMRIVLVSFFIWLVPHLVLGIWH